MLTVGKKRRMVERTVSEGLYAIALTISFMAFIPPDGLSMIGLSEITVGWKGFMVLTLAMLLIAFIRGSVGPRGLRIDSVALLILAVVALLGFYTLFQDGSIFYYGQKVAYIAGPWLIVVLFLRDRPALFISVVSKVLLVVCVVNLLAIAIYLPRGSFRPEIGDFWLFGQRTYMRNILFPALLFSLLDDRIRRKKISVSTAFLLATNPMALYLVESMTSLTVCLALEAIVATMVFFNRKLFLLKFAAVVAVVVDVVVVHVRHISFLEDFITKVLGRNMTFSGRTQVWDASIDALMSNPFSGTGIQALEDSGLTLASSKQLSNAHNEFLDLTFKGGILTAIAWVCLVARCCYPLTQRKQSWMSVCIGLFIGAFLFEAILGDVFYPEFFLILYMAAYIGSWEGLCCE